MLTLLKCSDGFQAAIELLYLGNRLLRLLEQFHVLRMLISEIEIHVLYERDWKIMFLGC